MNDVSGHGGMVVAVKHEKESLFLQRWSEVTLLDGSVHRFSQYGFHRQVRHRELDYFVDVQGARRMFVLWVLKQHSRWKIGEDFVCLGRLWIQFTPRKIPHESGTKGSVHQ